MAVRVFIATSLDGFIAGPGDDLSWLPGEEAFGDGTMPEGALGYDDFIAEVGALLMGRRTYDVVRGFDLPEWPYGDRPVLVATTRPLDRDPPRTVRRISGTIDGMIDAAVAAAGGRDVYLDGGALIRSALEAGRVDELIVSVAPVVLGAGVPLFAGLKSPVRMRILSHADHPGRMVQLRLAPDS